MKAVLVGTVGDDKLYYIIDATANDKDGAIEREDGTVVRIDFMSFSSSARSLKKIRTSPFHRKLWDAPRNMSSGSWYETFISKEKEVDEKMLAGLPVYSALGKDRKKIDKINEKSLEFSSSGLANQILSKSANGPVVKFDKPKRVFNTKQERKDAWLAMNLLRKIEESDNA
jgi:hypothetical protein